MASFIIEVDLLGWVNRADEAGAFEPGPEPAVANFESAWTNVTMDGLAVGYKEYPADFPDLHDIEATCRHYEGEVRRDQGAIISCDVIKLGESAGVRLIAKYKREGSPVAGFRGQLLIPKPPWILIASIGGSPAGMTGLRESMVFAEFANAASKSDYPRLKPEVEFAFDRYDPASKSALTYLLCDDEKYDARFPDHPLSRVRKSLYRQESRFRVFEDVSGKLTKEAPRGKEANTLFGTAAEPQPAGSPPGAPVITIRRMDTMPTSPQNLVEVVGHRVAHDLLFVEVLRKAGLAIPPLVNRQQSCLDQMAADFKKTADQIDEWNRGIQETAERSKSIRRSLHADNTFAWIARLCDSGEWLTFAGIGERMTLPVFTSAAHIDDFIEAKRLKAEPVTLSLRDLFALFPTLQNWKNISLEFNRCPRCSEPRPSKSLDAFQSESDVLDGYAAMLAVEQGMVEKNLTISKNLTDTGVRLEGLQYTLWHIDPGAPAIHLEMAKIAAAAGYTELLQRCRQKLAHYAPDYLPLAPE